MIGKGYFVGRSGPGLCLLGSTAAFLAMMLFTVGPYQQIGLGANIGVLSMVMVSINPKRRAQAFMLRGATLVLGYFCIMLMGQIAAAWWQPFTGFIVGVAISSTIMSVQARRLDSRAPDLKASPCAAHRIRSA